jgi:hypothetical protein
LSDVNVRILRIEGWLKSLISVFFPKQYLERHNLLPKIDSFHKRISSRLSFLNQRILMSEPLLRDCDFKICLLLTVFRVSLYLISSERTSSDSRVILPLQSVWLL